MCFPYPQDGECSGGHPLTYAHACHTNPSPSLSSKGFSTPSTDDAGYKIMITVVTGSPQPQFIAWTQEQLVHE